MTVAASGVRAYHAAMTDVILAAVAIGMSGGMLVLVIALAITRWRARPRTDDVVGIVDDPLDGDTRARRTQAQPPAAQLPTTPGPGI